MAFAVAPSASVAAGSIDPGQIEKRFEAPPAPRAQPPVVVPQSAAPLPPDKAAQIRFVLTGVELTGATVIAPGDLAPLYAELIDHEVSLADVYRLAERVTALYGNRGYLLSRAVVPPQTITDGAVRLAAVEGYVDKVVFEGHAPDRPALFDYLAERIRESRPLNAAVLERYTLLANDLPGVKAQVVLKPSADQSGAATLVMDLQQRRYDGMVSLDNYGTEAVGPDQFMAEGSVNSLFGLYDRTTLRVATVPSDADELNYYFLGHSEVLGGEGTVLSLSVTQSRSTPGGDMLHLIGVDTRSDSAEVAVTWPWLRSRSENVSVKAALDYRDSETILMDTFSSGQDRQYIVRATINWDRADRWGGLNMVNFTLNRGLDAFDGKATSKQGAKVDFTSYAVQASRQQTLTDRWGLLVRASGQFTDDTLPAAELYGIGGESVGRGYDPSEFVADQGVGGSVDLQFRPDVEWVSFIQTYLFLDGAVLSRNHAVNEAKEQTITSGGLGVRIATQADVSFSLEAAAPFHERASDADNNDWRLFGRLTARF
jgi:hemolysin activation/secretion protein